MKTGFVILQTGFMIIQTGFVLLQTGFEINIKIGVSVGCHRKWHIHIAKSKHLK